MILMENWLQPSSLKCSLDQTLHSKAMELYNRSLLGQPPPPPPSLISLEILVLLLLNKMVWFYQDIFTLFLHQTLQSTFNWNVMLAAFAIYCPFNSLIPFPLNSLLIFTVSDWTLFFLTHVEKGKDWGIIIKNKTLHFLWHLSCDKASDALGMKQKINTEL